MANQKQGGKDGGNSGHGVREGAQEVGRKIQEGASQLGERVRDGYDDAREGLAHGYRQAEGVIARNPAQSVLVGFGVGFGLGVLLTVLLSQREEEPWYDRYVPDRLRNLHLPDAIARHMPGH